MPIPWKPVADDDDGDEDHEDDGEEEEEGRGSRRGARKSESSRRGGCLRYPHFSDAPISFMLFKIHVHPPPPPDGRIAFNYPSPFARGKQIKIAGFMPQKLLRELCTSTGKPAPFHLCS